ncbi:efflux RND transporter permease subunit [Fulvivirga kasyanovii]|uniref:Efflux RND transporter permease subunit n=1 Tax=Fulvivirga kasyanovii TaxID=396812 RepID=A0ABW9RXK8_9BACT|nr:efflux RND transporter permease subunit [Fulvivirga kasyanovii]MTI28009.1 efflux RND transporter permease subunit [Fulvivirga kasyanovii]
MSSLSSISIDRPVLAIVMSITIILFGLVGFNFLGVREYPSVDPPIITVSTSYAGANSDVIETQITEPLEESINGIEGIKTLSSVSREGRSTIRVEFGLDTDLEAAANDVRDKVSRAVRNLPPDADPPIVSKADADSSPIIALRIFSKKRNLLEMSEIADNTFKENFQTIEGVSEVRVWGEKRYSIRLWMDPEKLAAYQVTPLDVYEAVNAQNLELPSGRIEGSATELTVRTLGRLNTPEQYNNLIIREDEEAIIRFRDVGRAEFFPENDRTVLKNDGIPMVMTAIVPQPGTNNLSIAEDFYKRLEGIKKNLPDDIDVSVAFDNTEYIQDSINEVEQTIYLAFFLVVLIIFIFLRDWRTTFIPVITVPIALIGAFFLMYLFNFSINVLTMLGIVLAIGLVVDDAIVVLENIYSKIEGGEEPMQAGKRGTEEIFFAVISTTVALSAVFFPIIFLQGITGRLFREFGLVVAGSVIISSFVALTLTPMLSSKLLKRRERHNWLYRKTEPFFVKLNNVYGNALDSFMKHRWVAFVIVIISGFAIYALIKQLPDELAPLEDRGTFRVIATGPEGATFEYMDFYVDQMIDMTQEEVPENESIISITSPGFGASSSVNSAFVIVKLKDAEKRERSQSEIVDALKPKIAKNTRARAFVTQPQTIGDRRGGLPVQFVIQAPNLEQLKNVLPEFQEKAQASSIFDFVDLDLKFNKPELNVTINRDKARDLGVSVRNVAQTLQLTLSGQRFGYFVKDGKQYYIIGQVERENRNDPLDLRSIYVKNDEGEIVQMDNLVTLEEKSTPPQLFRYNRFASATFSASLAPGYTLGAGLDEMDRIAAEVLDGSFSTALAGSSLEYQESANNLYFAFGFALILIYLVLAAQFESFRDPLIIMFTVPLALAGTLLSLWFFGETLNIFSQIGIIMLIGLVTKNGILIVEFANQRKAHDMDIKEAIIGAAKARFRPILMTSLSTILGILPIALALGAGSESRVSMGIAVIGGMLFATILTLFVIPAVYTYITSKHKRLARL